MASIDASNREEEALDEEDFIYDKIDSEYGNKLHADALEFLSQTLFRNEDVEIVISGTADQAIIVTPHRLFVYKRGGVAGVMGGSKFTSWDLDSVEAVHYEFGRITGFVAILTPSTVSTDMSYWDNSSESPLKIPNAIGFGEKQKSDVQDGVAQLRTLLFWRKHPELVP